jgi:hypothetical protein
VLTGREDDAPQHHLPGRGVHVWLPEWARFDHPAHPTLCHMRGPLPRFREHLDSPQFPDLDPDPEESPKKSGMSLTKFSGGWVAPGQPRWRAYLFYGLSLIAGFFLAITSGPGGFDLLAFGGVAAMALGVFGLTETVLGKRIWRP